MSCKAGFLIALILGLAISAAGTYGFIYTPSQATVTQQQSTITALTTENTRLIQQTQKNLNRIEHAIKDHIKHTEQQNLIKK